MTLAGFSDFLETFTVTRYAASTLGSDGRQVRGASSTFEADIIVQDVNGEDLAMLSSLDSTDVTKKAYTTTELRTLSEANRTDADQVDIDGETFEVHKVERQRKIIPHYKLWLRRLTV